MERKDVQVESMWKGPQDLLEVSPLPLDSPVSSPVLVAWKEEHQRRTAEASAKEQKQGEADVPIRCSQPL